MMKTTSTILALTAIGASAKKGDVKCSTPAQYEISITNTWTDADHPNDYPSDAHLSPTVGVSHNSGYGMWATGFQATSGAQSVAETGDPTALLGEIDAAAGYVLSSDALGDAFFFADNSVAETLDETLFLNVTEDFSKVSTMHMLANSPDWFTGVSGLELCVGGKWAESVTVSSQPYDAGTDCGTTYYSADCVEASQLNVQTITAASASVGLNGTIFVKDGAVAPVAEWTFTLVEEEKEPKKDKDDDDKSKPKPKKDKDDDDKSKPKPKKDKDDDDKSKPKPKKDKDDDDKSPKPKKDKDDDKSKGKPKAKKEDDDKEDKPKGKPKEDKDDDDKKPKKDKKDKDDDDKKPKKDKGKKGKKGKKLRH